MIIGGISKTLRADMEIAKIAAVDTSKDCPNCKTSLWSITPEYEDGKIVGFDGKCYLCGRPEKLGVKYLSVRTNR
jgi:hypothetical protein